MANGPSLGLKLHQKASPKSAFLERGRERKWRTFLELSWRLHVSCLDEQVYLNKANALVCFFIHVLHKLARAGAATHYGQLETQKHALSLSSSPRDRRLHESKHM